MSNSNYLQRIYRSTIRTVLIWCSSLLLLCQSAKPHGVMGDLKDVCNKNVFVNRWEKQQRQEVVEGGVCPVDAHILRILRVKCERKRERMRRWERKVAKGRRQKQRWWLGLLIGPWRERGGGVELKGKCGKDVNRYIHVWEEMMSLYPRFKKRNPLLCFFNNVMKCIHCGHIVCLCGRSHP